MSKNKTLRETIRNIATAMIAKKKKRARDTMDEGACRSYFLHKVYSRPGTLHLNFRTPIWFYKGIEGKPKDEQIEFIEGKLERMFENSPYGPYKSQGGK